MSTSDAYGYYHQHRLMDHFFRGLSHLCRRNISTAPPKNCSSNLTEYNELKLFTL